MRSAISPESIVLRSTVGIMRTLQRCRHYAGSGNCQSSEVVTARAKRCWRDSAWTEYGRLERRTIQLYRAWNARLSTYGPARRARTEHVFVKDLPDTARAVAAAGAQAHSESRQSSDFRRCFAREALLSSRSSAVFGQSELVAINDRSLPVGSFLTFVIDRN
jgi:hypothetical protein